MFKKRTESQRFTMNLSACNTNEFLSKGCRSSIIWYQHQRVQSRISFPTLRPPSARGGASIICCSSPSWGDTQRHTQIFIIIKHVWFLFFFEGGNKYCDVCLVINNTSRIGCACLQTAGRERHAHISPSERFPVYTYIIFIHINFIPLNLHFWVTFYMHTKYNMIFYSIILLR